MFEKIQPLANTYDDSIIWDFLKTKNNVVNSMDRTLSTDSGCDNEDCELSYNGADQEFLEIFDVGYNKKENKFLDIENIEHEELEKKGIEYLDYFQFYYCPACGMLSYYIE